MSTGGVGPAKEPERRKPDVEEDYGYGYYPSRSQYPQKVEEKPRHWFVKLNDRKPFNEMQCASSVADCIENSEYMFKIKCHFVFASLLISISAFCYQKQLEVVLKWFW